MFDKQMSEVTVTMPILYAFVLSLPYQRFLKNSVKDKQKTLEDMVVLTHECSAIIQRRCYQRRKMILVALYFHALLEPSRFVIASMI